MFVIEDLLATSSSAVGMIPSIINVIKQLESSEDKPSAQRLIQELISKTKENCENMLSEVEGIEEEMKIIFEHEILNSPLKSIYDDLTWYQDPIVKFKLSRRLIRLSNIRLEIINSTDNLTALILCNGSIKTISVSYNESYGIRQSLAKMTVNDSPFLEQTKVFKQLLNDYILNLSPASR